MGRRTQPFSALILCIIGIIFIGTWTATASPLAREPRQVNIRQKPDGTIVASFAASNAFDGPGFDNSFAMSETFEIGPRGSSSSSSSAFNSDIGGNQMSFANSNAQNQRSSPFGGGGGFSAANAGSSSFNSPFFSGSNANANAYGANFPGFGKR